MKDAPISIAIVGGGPAGLMAAETAAAAGHRVTIYDRMPTLGRKLLMAGRGGLNLTHSEPLDRFLTRYGAEADPRLLDAVRTFPPAATIAWAEQLGQATFIGSSGRVFPRAMKASPLLRAWLARLVQAGVVFRVRTQLVGVGPDRTVTFSSEERITEEHFDAIVLAFGGASWPRLGSDGGWAPLLQALGISITDLQPANVGVRVAWSEHLRAKCAGKPLKRIAISIDGERQKLRGEAVVTNYGLEGGAIYAIGAALAPRLAAASPVSVVLDLRPDLSHEQLAAKLGSASAKQSLSNTLRKQAGLDAVATSLLYEGVRFNGALPRAAAPLAERVKNVRIPVDGFAGLERAISSTGGVSFAEIDDKFMLRKLPGVFVAGEMLDWSAPTGGYLLQACLATGIAAADGVKVWVSRQP